MKVKLYYFYKTGWLPKGQSPIEVSTIDWRGFEENKIFIEELDADVPDCRIPSKEEITAGIIDDLKNQKNSILAETHKKVSAIEDKIQQLLCIELKP